MLPSILARRRGPLLALASGAARQQQWTATLTTTTTTAAAASPSSSSPSDSGAPTPTPPTTTVDLPTTVDRILRSLEHERSLGCGDARGARASFSEFMAGAQGLARLETAWLPPSERAALARLRGAYAEYSRLPLPAREALLADTARLADRHAHFLREGAWPSSSAGGAAVQRERERSPSPPPSRQQQPQPRPGSVLRRRAGLPHVSPPRQGRAPSASMPPASSPHQQQQQRPATASASPLPAAAAPAAAPLPPLEEAAPIPQESAEEERFAAALDQLLPFGEEPDEDASAPVEVAGVEDEEDEEGGAAEAAASASPAPPDEPPLPPLPFRAPPSHPALRRLQRRTSTGSSSSVAQEQQQQQQQQAASLAFEPLLHDHPPPAQQQQQQQPQPAPPAAAATPSPAPSPSPQPAGTGVDLGAAWRLYWPVPPLEHWRELDAARASAVAAASAAGHDDDDDEGDDDAAVRARPMMPTESLGPRDDGSSAAAVTPQQSQTAAARTEEQQQPSSSSLAALFEEMCSPQGAPGLGAFVEEPALLPLAAGPPPDEFWGPGPDDPAAADAAGALLRDDAGSAFAASSSSSDALLAANATAATVATVAATARHLVWRPAVDGLLLPNNNSDRLFVHTQQQYDDDDDHAAWRAFVESAVAWRRRDDADARALRALARSPDEDQQRTPDWHAARGSRLTASAFCNAVGWFGRYPAARLLDAQRLWREKVGLEPPPPPNAAMRRGTALEPLAQRAYARLVAQARGGRVEPCSFKTWSEGPAHDWLSASPDGLVQVPSMMRGEAAAGAAEATAAAAAAAAASSLPPALALAQGPGVLEIKCPNKDLPDPAQHVRRLDYYAMQVQGQLEFSGREWAHLYLWTPSSGSAVAFVRRDRAYWRLLWQVLADFWWGHVAPARVLRREGASDRDVMAYLPRREHPWASELRARSRLMLRDAPVLAFGKEPTAAAAAEAAMAAAEAAAGSEMQGSV